jgi:hypothetical protein
MITYTNTKNFQNMILAYGDCAAWVESIQRDYIKECFEVALRILGNIVADTPLTYPSVKIEISDEDAQALACEYDLLSFAEDIGYPEPVRYLITWQMTCRNIMRVKS